MILRKSYFTIDNHSYFVLRYHNWITTIKPSTNVKHFFGIKHVKKHDKNLKITEFLISKTQDLVIRRAKNKEPSDASCQKHKWITFWRLQIYLVTYYLVFNTQWKILYQNPNPYYQTFDKYLCYQHSQNVRKARLYNQI